jgi:hypothetical protein
MERMEQHHEDVVKKKFGCFQALDTIWGMHSLVNASRVYICRRIVLYTVVIIEARIAFTHHVQHFVPCTRRLVRSCMIGQVSAT